MTSPISNTSCPQCGTALPPRTGGRGRPRVWCSTECRKSAYGARRAAAGNARPVEVVTIATERTKYVRVPLRELRRALNESSELTVEFVRAVKQIASNTGALTQAAQQTVRDALAEACVATMQSERNEIDKRIEIAETKERNLEQREAQLRQRETELKKREARGKAPADFQALLNQMRR